MSVLFIFIDGIGLGKPGKKNPFDVDHYESFNFLSRGRLTSLQEDLLSSDHIFKGIDANLGVKGLPQSGTGQTTLFTGNNAAKEIGKHFGPYPHSGIKHLLKEKSIFKEVKDLQKEPYFINAYPPVFFEYARKRNRWSCTTLMTKAADMKLNSTEEVIKGRALTAEIVQNAWREKLNIDLPKITATEAAERVLNMMPEKDLLLYEYYLTDKAGHSQKKEDAEQVLNNLDEFLIKLIQDKKGTDTIVITSDHGNLEDLSVKTHTRNRIPLFVYGPEAINFKNVRSLTDIKKCLLQSV